MITIRQGYEQVDRRHKWDQWIYWFADNFWDYLVKNKYTVHRIVANRIFGHKNFLIIYRDNRYWAVDPDDLCKSPTLRIKEFKEDDNCIGILKAQYRPWISQLTHSKVMPWLYFPRDPEAYFNSDIESHPTHSERKLHWRGVMSHGRRGILNSLKDILNDSTLKVPLEQYLDEVNSHKVILSLPGVANLNHRDIELFGMGAAVLRPTLKTELYTPLIPDYHYIASGDTSEDIRKRYHEVIDDDEFLESIRANARKWYEDNIKPPSCFIRTMECMGWDQL